MILIRQHERVISASSERNSVAPVALRAPRRSISSGNRGGELDSFQSDRSRNIKHHPEQVSRISRIRVKPQVTPERPASPEARHHTVPPGGIEPPTHGLGNDVQMRRCADCAANSMTIPCAIDAPLRQCAAPLERAQVWEAPRTCVRLPHSLCEMACFEEPSVRGLGSDADLPPGRSRPVSLTWIWRCHCRKRTSLRLHQLPYVVSCPGMPGTSAPMLMTRESTTAASYRVRRVRSRPTISPDTARMMSMPSLRCVPALPRTEPRLVLEGV
jgi:hypothetical protein